jgi:hypothetical protein
MEDGIAGASAVFNPHAYGADPTGTTDSAAALQAMFDDMSKGQIAVLHGVYRVDSPITVPDGIVIQGGGWGVDGNDGATLRIGGTPTGGTWNKRGVIESAAYRQTGGTAVPGDPIIIRDLKIDGNNSTVGNGLILMNQRCVVERVAVYNFLGTTADSDGYCIWLPGSTFPSDASAAVELSQSAVNNTFRTLRLEGNNSRFYVSDVTSRYTDGVLEHVVCVIQPTASNVPDIDLAHAGGWLIIDTHHNGSGGHCIRLRSAFQTQITGCNFDGWGLGNTSGTSSAVRVDNFGTGVSVTSCLLVQGNRFKIRAGQVSTGIYNAVSIQNNTAGVAPISLIGNLVYAESGATGTLNFFQLQGSGGVSGVVAGNVIERNGGSGNVHSGDQSSNGNALLYTGNGWQRVSAAPSAGWWPAGSVAWNQAPSAGGTPGWVCTTAGTPGTWKAMANLAA